MDKIEMTIMPGTSADGNEVEAPNPLDELTARHEAILLALVAGNRACDVAAQFGITDSRLSILRSSPLWRTAELKLRNQLREDAVLQLESLRGVAVEALCDTVARVGPIGVPNDPAIRLQSARQILDRAGIPAAGSPIVGMNIAPTINLYIPPAWRQDAPIAE